MTFKKQRTRFAWVVGFVLAALGISSVGASGSFGAESETQVEKKAGPSLQKRFDTTVLPFLKSHCLACHGPDKTRGDVTLHATSADPKDTKAVALWSQVLEQLEIMAMPPEKKPQPSVENRQEVVEWVSDYLEEAGKGFELKSKRLLPEYANRVSHELLFNGTIKEMPASPARLWRISPYIFAGKGYLSGPGSKAQPLAFSTKTDGIRDYSSQEIVGEAGFLSLMMTFDDILSRQMHDSKTGPGNPTFKAISEAKGPPTAEAMEKAVREEFMRATSRPVADDELARYLKFMDRNIKQAGNESGLKITMMAIYLSPEAIYRMEFGMGKPDEHGRRILSPREIGFAVAYALTDLPPSKVRIIQEALEKKQLSTRANVERVMRKLIAEGAPPNQLGLPGFHDSLRAQGKRGYAYYPRVQRFFEEFFEYPRVATVFKDAKRGTFGPRATPGVTQGTIASILNDDKNVFAELLASPRFNDSRERLLSLLEANHMERLKKLPENKKADAIKEYEKKRQEIQNRTKDENYRAGVLTDPSWLMVHAKCVANDPVRRGKWIRERLLAGSVPDLPIGVDAKVPEDHDRTLRQRFDVVKQDACWKCHKHMNPLGDPFEMYDDFGRYRTGLYYDPKRKEFIEQNEWDRISKKKDNGIIAHKVDATGVLSGTGDPALDGEVKDAIDLVQRLAKSSRVRQSIIRHAFRYWMGRNETLSDSKTLIAADEAYVRSGGSFSEVIISLVTSDSFLYRK